MNNDQLIDSLNDQYLLSLAELLARALMMPEESLRYIANEELFYDLPFEAIAHCEDLNDYERLKLMQQVVNINDALYRIGTHLELEAVPCNGNANLWTEVETQIRDDLKSKYPKT